MRVLSLQRSIWVRKKIKSKKKSQIDITVLWDTRASRFEDKITWSSAAIVSFVEITIDQTVASSTVNIFIEYNMHTRTLFILYLSVCLRRSETIARMTIIDYLCNNRYLYRIHIIYIHIMGV